MLRLRLTELGSARVARGVSSFVTRPFQPHSLGASPTKARLVGLIAKPELNGKVGTVLRADDATGRLVVELEGYDGPVRVAPQNLEYVVKAI